jgi:hypothetical protein
MKLDCWFWRRLLEIISNIKLTHEKMISLLGSFQVNLTFSGSVVLEIFFIWSYSGDYFPFEEDLALYLNNFEFPLPKVDLHLV